MSDKMKPLQKLNEAIMTLKEAGYEFTEHTITDTKMYGTYKHFSKRVIELRCFKNFPPSDTGEEVELKNLTGFTEGPTC